MATYNKNNQRPLPFAYENPAMYIYEALKVVYTPYLADSFTSLTNIAEYP